MKKLSLTDLDVQGKRVLVRVDFNVPLDKSQKILDDTRIRASLPTIEYLLQHGAIIILASHLGRPEKKSPEFSLAPIAKHLSSLLKKEVIMLPDSVGNDVEDIINSLKPGTVALLENVRFYPAEEKPNLDPTFAQNLAKLADLYVNDAFGTAHRAHSSTCVVAKYFPNKAAAGLLLQKEIDFLGNALSKPSRPFFAIVGGAKVSTKLGVLRSLLNKVDALFIGGGMAYSFLKAQGKKIGLSLCEDNMLTECKNILKLSEEKNIPLYLPLDIHTATHFDNLAQDDYFETEKGIPDDYMGLDIGPKTIAFWSSELKKAKTILWNGPVGVFEFTNFSQGTQAIATTLACLKDAVTICGGGETVQAVTQAGLESKFSHLSTGGGASLEYIEHGTLPGIDALSTS